MKEETEYKVIKVIILFIVVVSLDTLFREVIFTASLEWIKEF